MIALRLLGLALLIIALMFLGADLVTSFETGGTFVTRSPDQIIAMLAGSSLMSWIEAALPSSLASIVTVPLRLPAWFSFGLLGILFALIAGSGKN